MATGPDMLRALKCATQDVSPGSNFRVNVHDKLDLCKLTTQDLVSAGFAKATAERIGTDLRRESLEELGSAMGIRLVPTQGVLTLIPGEGARRAAEILKDDPQTLDEMLEEMRMIRNWSRNAS